MTEMEEIKTMLADMNKKLDRVILQNKIAMNTKYGSPIKQETEELCCKKFREVKYEAVKEFAEKLKMAFFYEFDEIIPSIMSDKIDELLKEYEKLDRFYLEAKGWTMENG